MRRTTKVVFETATTAKGMTKRDTALFHLCNPNGLRAQLPETDEYQIGDSFWTGASILYSKYSSWTVKELEKIVEAPHKVTRWEVKHIVAQLEKQVEEAQQFIAEKKAA